MDLFLCKRGPAESAEPSFSTTANERLPRIIVIFVFAARIATVTIRFCGGSQVVKRPTKDTYVMSRISCLLLLSFTGCASLGPLNPMRPVERSLLFHPTAVEAPSAGRDFESVFIEGNDGGTIHGLFLPHPQAQAVVLYCHGNAGNIVDRLPRLKQLRDQNQISILGFDYRGYGASDGTPAEAGLYADARSSRKWLAERCNVSEEDIVLLGRSLGGAVAVELAASDGARGLILESTFTSIEEVGKSHVKWIPVSFLVSQRFDSVNKIGKYGGPLLQSHGTADEVIPFALGQRLHEAANTASKRFVTLPGGHAGPLTDEYETKLANFIASLKNP